MASRPVRARSRQGPGRCAADLRPRGGGSRCPLRAGPGGRRCPLQGDALSAPRAELGDDGGGGSRAHGAGGYPAEPADAAAAAAATAAPAGGGAGGRPGRDPAGRAAGHGHQLQLAQPRERGGPGHYAVRGEPTAGVHPGLPPRADPLRDHPVDPAGLPGQDR